MSDERRNSLRSRPEVDTALRLLGPGSAVVVMVFGSAARGDETELSDFDLLVVVRADDQVGDLVSRLREHSSRTHIPMVMTPASLVREARRRPSFVAHLLAEGIVIEEAPEWTELRETLGELTRDRDAIRREVSVRARDLEPFTHIERFRCSPITARSHLYAIARSLVIARLLEEGVQEFRWALAFDRYADLHPELRGDLIALKALRPYYEYARARSSRLPDAGPRITDRALVASVAQLAR